MRNTPVARPAGLFDDATRRLQELRFAPESTFDYFESTRHYVERHGKPVAFYSDKLSVFRVNAKDPKAGDHAVWRALSELNIDITCANTAAAKGRVERETSRCKTGL